MPQVIDLDFAGTAADGAPMYATPLVAGVSRLVIEHPQEMIEAAGFCLRAAGLAGVVGAILYFARGPSKPKPRARAE
jgi:hypothetical protein